MVDNLFKAVKQKQPIRDINTVTVISEKDFFKASGYITRIETTGGTLTMFRKNWRALKLVYLKNGTLDLQEIITDISNGDLENYKIPKLIRQLQERK